MLWERLRYGECIKKCVRSFDGANCLCCDQVAPAPPKKITDVTHVTRVCRRLRGSNVIYRTYTWDHRGSQSVTYAAVSTPVWTVSGTTSRSTIASSNNRPPLAGRAPSTRWTDARDDAAHHYSHTTIRCHSKKQSCHHNHLKRHSLAP